jgi:hypothetical protein
MKELIIEPINTDARGNAYTLNTRYPAMASGNVIGGWHFPMTAVCERWENTPPLNRARFKSRSNGTD